MKTYKAVISWVLLAPLTYLCVQGAFSFTNTVVNNPTGAQNASLVGGGDGTAGRLQLVLILGMMLGFVVTRLEAVLNACLRNKLIAACPILALLSMAWSQSPLTTLRSAMTLLVVTLFVFYLCDRFDPERLIRLFMFVGTVTAVASVLFALLLPGYGVQHRGTFDSAWQGIFSQKNLLGSVMAFLLTPALFVSLKTRYPWRAAYIGLLLLLIMKSQSRGAWIVTAGLLAFVFVMNTLRRFDARSRVALLLNGCLFGIPLVAVGIAYAPQLLALIGKDPTMTGRTGIWSAIMVSVLKRPLLGYGFGAFWLGTQGESFNVDLAIHWFGMAYAENGMLELWLELGLVGLALVILLYGRALRHTAQLFRHYYTPQLGWYLSILFLEAINNIEAGKVMVPTTIDWTLVMVACVGLANETRRIPVEASRCEAVVRQRMAYA